VAVAVITAAAAVVVVVCYQDQFLLALVLTQLLLELVELERPLLVMVQDQTVVIQALLLLALI
jgi:hypothetical protein